MNALAGYGHIAKVHLAKNNLVITLANGDRLLIPLFRYPRLRNASQEQLRDWHLIGEGEGIHWPQINEDLSLAGLFIGRRATAHWQGGHVSTEEETTEGLVEQVKAFYDRLIAARLEREALRRKASDLEQRRAGSAVIQFERVEDMLQWRQAREDAAVVDRRYKRIENQAPLVVEIGVWVQHPYLTSDGTCQPYLIRRNRKAPPDVVGNNDQFDVRRA